MLTKKQKKSYRRSLLGFHKDKKVKYIEPVSKKEYDDIELFKRLRSSMSLNDSWHKFHVSGEDGSSKTFQFRSIHNDSNFFKDFFNEGHVVNAIKIWYSDGTFEYGLYYFNYKTITLTKRKVLVPIYIKVGSLNLDNGEIQDDDTLIQVPGWVLKKMYYYNDGIGEKLDCNASTCSNPKIGVDYLDNFRIVRKYLANPKLTANEVEYSIPPKSNANRKLAWRVTMFPCGNVDDNCYGSATIPFASAGTYFNCFGDGSYTIHNYGYGGREEVHTANAISNISCYSYLKSIYEDVTVKKKVTGIIPASSLLMVTKSNGYGKNSYDIEVWNNLDETVKGNL